MLQVSKNKNFKTIIYNLIVKSISNFLETAKTTYHLTRDDYKTQDDITLFLASDWMSKIISRLWKNSWTTRRNEQIAEVKTLLVTRTPVLLILSKWSSIEGATSTAALTFDSIFLGLQTQGLDASSSITKDNKQNQLTWSSVAGPYIC